MRHISQCLNRQLQQVCQTSMRMEALDAEVLKHLPETLQKHCRVAAFTNGRLIISTEKPEIASQVSYLMPALRDTLRKQKGFYHLILVQVRVLFEEQTSYRPKEKERREGSAIAMQALKEAYALCK